MKARPDLIAIFSVISSMLLIACEAILVLRSPFRALSAGDPGRAAFSDHRE